MDSGHGFSALEKLLMGVVSVLSGVIVVLWRRTVQLAKYLLREKEKRLADTRKALERAEKVRDASVDHERPPKKAR